MDVEDHVAVLRLLHEAQVFAEIAKPVVEHHRHPLGRAVFANALVGGQVVGLEVVGGHVPAWFVEHLDGVQRRMVAIALGQAFKHAERVFQIFRTGVPLADILDPAVVEAVLAAGRGVQVEYHAQAELLCPVHGAVEHRDAAHHEGMAAGAIARVIGVVGAEDPVPQRNAHGVQAVLGQPGEIVAGDESVPVAVQFFASRFAQLGAPGGFIGGGQPLEQAGHHPLLQYQPAAQVDPAQLHACLLHAPSPVRLEWAHALLFKLADPLWHQAGSCPHRLEVLQQPVVRPDNHVPGRY
ncbi:hypothetical protein D3C75_719080 [compost metagenome]